MFSSATPYREGYKDGYGKYPAYTGTYNDRAKREYLAGYREGAASRQANDIGFASI